MFIRYSYSPSFRPGWAVGVQLVVDTVVGDAEPGVSEGFIYTKTLKDDAYVRSSELGLTVSTALTPAELEPEDIASVTKIASEVTLRPGIFPWASMDGALSSLMVEAGDSSMTAEWNTEHPQSWSGLNELHEELYRLFQKYD